MDEKPGIKGIFTFFGVEIEGCDRTYDKYLAKILQINAA
jgi:hypothetical protein